MPNGGHKGKEPNWRSKEAGLFGGVRPAAQAQPVKAGARCPEATGRDRCGEPRRRRSDISSLRWDPHGHHVPSASANDDCSVRDAFHHLSQLSLGKCRGL